MTVPNQLGFGKTGWHGDESVSLRTSLSSGRGILLQFSTSFNNLLDILDSDSVVGDTNYNSTLEVDTGLLDPVGDGEVSEHLANGGSYTHGDDAVKLRVYLEAVAALTTEVKTQYNALLTKLDADAGIAATNYVSTCHITSTAMSAPSAHFANGGSYTHGDAGVALRTSLEDLVSLVNELKTKYNAMLGKLDADSLDTSTFASGYGITGPSA